MKIILAPTPTLRYKQTVNTPATHTTPGLPPADLPGRLGAILYAFVVALTNYLNPHPARLIAVNPACLYILRVRSRLARLLPRILAGHTPRPRQPSPTKTPRARPSRPRLSQARGWVMRDADHWVRGQRHYLEQTLAEPQTAALIAAHPGAQRLLRPLLHMLAIDAPCVPPIPRRAPRKPRAPRISKPRPPTYRERRAALWYSNIEGKPMNLLPPERSRRA